MSTGGQCNGQTQENRQQCLRETQQSFCFHPVPGTFFHLKNYTNKGVYKNGCFTLEKRCFTSWQLVFKQGSGHLQSYFLLLQQCKGRRESHLVFQDYTRCCTIPADNWKCDMVSSPWNRFIGSCNNFSFVLNNVIACGICGAGYCAGLSIYVEWGSSPVSREFK